MCALLPLELVKCPMQMRGILSRPSTIINEDILKLLRISCPYIDKYYSFLDQLPNRTFCDEGQPLTTRAYQALERWPVQLRDGLANFI